MERIPYYLKGFEELCRQDPRQANIAWLRSAKYGLFLTYGLYSLHDIYSEEGLQEWCQYNQKISVSEYEKLEQRFYAEKFDATYIVSFAKECGMKYINVTTRHHDSFCLWDTKYSEFNSMNSPAKRDLIQELYNECKKQNVGLILYYSHGRDWRHPHAPNNDAFKGAARPLYDEVETSYAYGKEHDLQIYVEFLKNQIIELIEKFPEAAAIWLDGQAVPASGDINAFHVQELYDEIHARSPHMLISYKQGVLGSEDFFSPEHFIPKSGCNHESNKSVADFQKEVSRVGKIEEHPDKLIEVNTGMIHSPVSWGYTVKGSHYTENEIFEQLQDAMKKKANFVINTGLMGNGKLDPIDEKILRNVGKHLKGGKKAGNE